MPRPPRIHRVAVCLDRTHPAAPMIFDGILPVARARGWLLGDETMAVPDAVIYDIRHPSPPARHRVSVSAGYLTGGDVRPDAALVHNLAAAHFLQRGFAGMVDSPKDVAALPNRTAVFARDDASAVGLLRATVAAGRRVPEEIALIGVGNDPLTCERCDVPLSSVDVGARQIGHRAAARLDRLLRGRPVPDADDVPPAGVVVRQSTEVLAIDDPDTIAAVRFIREHSDGPLRVGDILRAVRLDRRTLERRFAKHFGRSPSDYLRRYRLEHAADLLRNSQLPISAVAAACGFRLPQHLAAAFKRIHGCSPGDFRLLHRVGSID